jgi:hypothetical protein
MAIIKAGDALNFTIKKYDSNSIIITPDQDFTGWTLKYLVKERLSDTDIQAVISITPQLIAEDNLKKIIIPFTPTNTSSVVAGNDYHHALKAISSNNLTAITLFTGKLIIQTASITYPIT